MFKVYNYVPDNELPYLTFEKCQRYASLRAPARQAAFLWKVERELGAAWGAAGIAPEGCSKPPAWHGGQEGHLEACCGVVSRLCLGKGRGQRLICSEGGLAQGMEHTPK